MEDGLEPVEGSCQIDEGSPAPALPTVDFHHLAYRFELARGTSEGLMAFREPTEAFGQLRTVEIRPVSGQPAKDRDRFLRGVERVPVALQVAEDAAELAEPVGQIGGEETGLLFGQEAEMAHGLDGQLKGLFIAPRRPKPMDQPAQAACELRPEDLGPSGRQTPEEVDGFAGRLEGVSLPPLGPCAAPDPARQVPSPGAGRAASAG